MERKLATMLFADLVGSTELGASLDPEHTRDLLERFYDSMEAEIALGGGTVEKFIGDAVVAVFGAPAAQEDHAERALQVALWMQERLVELFGERLALRIGVNTGEVVVGRPREGSSFATGDAVNVAARLEQAARPGQVLVGARTAALAGGAFAFGEPLTVEAKGKEGGVPARELVHMVAARRPRGTTVEFVGRRRELEWLEQAVAATRGRPRLALVVGDPGIGKTALVRELRERLPADTTFLVGRCLPYGRGVTYSPLAEVLRRHLGLREEDAAETVLERLGDRQILGLTLGLDVAGDLEPRSAVLALQDEWVRLVSELGRAVLVVEDLHWAAEQLLELLSRVLDHAHGPVLILGTTRPGREGPAGDSLVLEPLGEDEAGALVEATLGAPLEARARELVVRHTEGNPFFVEEVLSELVDRGGLGRSNGSWVLVDTGGGLGIPDSVQGVLAARIDLLQPEAKEALQAAAVIGRSFSPAGLASLVGSAAQVRTLVERGFVRPTEPELVFKHALTREVAYGGLPKAERARLHATYADWLAADDAGDARAGALAYHYAEAVAPQIVDLAWRDDEKRLAALRKSALRWLDRATELALGRFDLDDALVNLHRAGELEPGDARIWHRIGQVNALKFDGAAMWPAMERAIELTDDDEQLADIYGELAFESSMRGGMWNPPLDHELAAGWVERALELAPEGSRAHARALITKASWEDDAGVAAEAVAAAERLDDPVLLSYAYWARSGAAFIELDYPAAYEWATRRFSLLDRLGDPDKIAHVHYYGATAALATGRIDEAVHLARRHDEIASRLSTHHEVHALGVLLFVEEALAHWEEIRGLQPRVERAVADNTGTPCVLNPRNLSSCAVACAALGLDGEADRLDADATSHGFQGYQWWLGPPAAHLALLRGDLERTEELFEEFRESWAWSMDGSPYAATVLLDGLLALGRNDEAAALAEEVNRAETYLEPFAARTLGVVREDPQLVEQAAKRFEAMGLDRHASTTRALAQA